MDYITLLLIAIGLSMDAFAVSITSGLAAPDMRKSGMFKIAASFGVFQGVMPLIGYTVARTFADKIQSLDHWIAFGLLAFVGGKMIFEAVRGGDDEIKGDPTKWSVLLVMAIATSIDALAVGASIAVTPKTGVLAYDAGYLICFGAITLVTLVISFAGVAIGKRFGNVFGKSAEIVGGIILIAIGTRILIEHLM